MIYKDKDPNKVKQCKERVTLILTSNMDGSEKFKPLFIVKSLNSRCLQGFKRCNLAAILRANANGWMTGTIFKEWVYAIDKK